MRITPTKLPGVVVVDPVVHRDPRGFFIERYHARTYAEHVLPREFVQDNHSRSVRGTLRGLHLQVSQLQGKLVYVLEGSIVDVAVDVRVGSPSFGQWVGVELTSDNFRQLYIPPGFAHGFCVTSDRADVLYKCTDYYLPGDEIAILWSDPGLAIQWPIMDPLLSVKDAGGFQLKHVMSRLPVYQPNGHNNSRDRESETAGASIVGDSA